MARWRRRPRKLATKIGHEVTEFTKVKGFFFVTFVSFVADVFVPSWLTVG